MIRIEPAGASLDLAHHQHREALPMWTVYRFPRDHPEHFVARMFFTLPQTMPTNVAVIADTLDEVRETLPTGLVRIDRSPADEPHIVETWL